MKYPENLKKGDYIGLTAPSEGITGDKNNKRADNAIKNFENRGFKVKETSNVRKSERCRSSEAKQRAKEFMELWTDKEVKSIICAEGGNFLCEMLDYLDFEEIKKYEPKWIQGYSDMTTLLFYLTTNNC